MSASQIKIMEPGAVGVGTNGAPAPTGGENERLVVITGQPANIQMAVQLLYHVSSYLLPVYQAYAFVAAFGTGKAEAASSTTEFRINGTLCNIFLFALLGVRS